MPAERATKRIAVEAAPGPGTWSARIFRPFLRRLRHLGVDVAALLAPRGLTAAALDDRDLRLSHAMLVELIDDAIGTARDGALGLHAAAAVEPGDFGVLEYAASSCRRLGDAMRCATRYIRLVHDAFRVELEVTTRIAGLRFWLAGGVDASPTLAEFTLACLLEQGRRLTQLHLRPLAVDFAHAVPDDRRSREAFFQAPVRFGAPENVLWFRVEALDLAPPSGDSGLHCILVQHAERLLTDRAPRVGFTDHVRVHAAAELCGGNPGAERVAEILGVSARTLHRRLKDEGTTFRGIVTELRLRLARQHLAAGWYSIAEIAVLLGFSNANAFHQAFRRWTGQTPAQWRPPHGLSPERRLL
jgi:AraC-like DNA-binding protein